MATAGAVPPPIGNPAGADADVDVADQPKLIINRSAYKTKIKKIESLIDEISKIVS